MRRGRNLPAFLRTNRIRERHEWRRITFFKHLPRRFRQNRWRERPKNLPMFDPPVQNLLHVRAPRISNNAPIPQRPRAPFSSPLKPAHDLSFRDDSCRPPAHLFFRQLGNNIATPRDATRVNSRTNLSRRILRSPVSVVHHKRTRFPELLMPDVKRRPYRQASVPGSRLHVNLLEWSPVKNLAVRHTIERYPAGNAHRFPSSALGQFS